MRKKWVFLSKITSRNLTFSTTGIGLPFRQSCRSGWSLRWRQKCKHTVFAVEKIKPLVSAHSGNLFKHRVQGNRRSVERGSTCSFSICGLPMGFYWRFLVGKRAAGQTSCQILWCRQGRPGKSCRRARIGRNPWAAGTRREFRLIHRARPSSGGNLLALRKLSCVGRSQLSECYSSRLGCALYRTRTSLAERSERCRWAVTDSCLVRWLGWAACSQCRIGASYPSCVRARRCSPMGSLPTIYSV